MIPTGKGVWRCGGAVAQIAAICSGPRWMPNTSDSVILATDEPLGRLSGRRRRIAKVSRTFAIWKKQIGLSEKTGRPIKRGHKKGGRVTAFFRPESFVFWQVGYRVQRTVSSVSQSAGVSSIRPLSGRGSSSRFPATASSAPSLTTRPSHT